MKTLLLMRHAKSSWKHPELPDAERGLARRGKKDAPLMGSLLKEKELVPESILCSTAERSRETAKALVEASGYKGEVVYQDTLYLAEPEAYLSALRALPDGLERALVIGHNPGLEGLLQLLSGRIEALPTSTIAYLSLPVQRWADLSAQSEGELVEVMHPRMVREMEKAGKKEKGKKKPEKKEKKKKK
jgi:phosphohistidine phosphatase